MIRVANIIEDGRIAGPQIRMIEVAKRLYQSDIDTTVIIPRLNSAALQDRLEQQQVKYQALPLHRLTKDPFHLLLFVLLFLYELVNLFIYFKKQRFDIVHVSGGAWQFKGVIAGKLVGAKVVWHLNDTSMPAVIMRLFSVISRCFADAFIVAGGAVGDYYKAVTGRQNKPIYVIQAPVDCTRFDPESVTGLLEDEMGSVKVVTVANVNPIKGLEYFIGMAQALNDQYPQVKYFIVGPVYQTQKKYFLKLQKLVDEGSINTVHFYGRTTDIPGVLKSASIYVCSSVAEASPTSVWEAMAMGKAIVSTDVGDVTRFIRNDESGYIVPANSAEALASKVALLIADEARRTRFGSAARKTAVAHLDLDIVTQAHLSCYRELSASGAAPVHD